jgi:hypothetical protein
MINAKTKLSNLEILLKCHDLSASRINETSFQLNTQYLDSKDYDKINSFFPAVVYEQKHATVYLTLKDIQDGEREWDNDRHFYPRVYFKENIFYHR